MARKPSERKLPARKYNWQPNDVEWVVAPTAAPLNDEQDTILYLLRHAGDKSGLAAALPNVEAYLSDHPGDQRVIELLQRVTESVSA